MNPDDVELNADALEALFRYAAESVDPHPLCAAQAAVARYGRLVAFRAFGSARCGGTEQDATLDTLFSIYSCTKAIVSAATWLLLQEGKFSLGDRVALRIPEFGSHGKERVTLEHLLTHTAGFPSASFGYEDWDDRERRLLRFASWKLDWEPGTRFVYHGNSTMWVLAELITRASGLDYRDFIRTRIVEPMGLRDLHIGLPESKHSRVADVISVGQALTTEGRAISPVDAPVIDEEMLSFANRAEARSVGGPSGGGIATAADVALFYQGLLADADPDAARARGAAAPGIYEPATLRDAWTPRDVDLVDPMTGQVALRGLGVVVAGESGRMWRGFAETCSARSFGHMGAGGQVAWADPVSGLSFAYFTNGAQKDPAQQGATGFKMSTRVASSAIRSESQ